MHSEAKNEASLSEDRLTRRGFLGIGAAGVVATSLGARSAAAAPTRDRPLQTLRWGVVGTGMIANNMAPMIQFADGGELSAVSSRRMATAREYADRHDVPNAFDSWVEMVESDVVDAIYVATPTSVREEIALAAANGGRHVLGEKPFASAASVQRIVDACRENDVAFMDGTHFVHHPRTREIQARREELLGTTRVVDSVFQFNLPVRSNIRYNRELEPMGAIGDAGWYNMRATVEYLPAGYEVAGASAFLRRDAETGAALGGSGVFQFPDGGAATWTCGFDSAAMVMDVRISGTGGVIYMDDFLYQNPDGSADFDLRRGAPGQGETMSVASAKPGAVLMFEDMAAAAADPSQREQWMDATLRTQGLLDMAWFSALENEG